MYSGDGKAPLLSLQADPHDEPRRLQWRRRPVHQSVTEHPHDDGMSALSWRKGEFCGMQLKHDRTCEARGEGYEEA